ncbi:LCP family protein [Bacillus sp. SG-1]|uniref:LCP family protein n=1 Tax=Bacillus sp. SG-1 TaxID=161544 RepID=UPI0003143CA6|nr:LCP family protein [Bacillus sp. SG-1]
MKAVRRIIQVAVCFLIINSCSDDWLKKEEAAENNQEIKSDSVNKKWIENTGAEGQQKEDNKIIGEKTEPLNMLIIGSDQRESEPSRADTIMIAQYHPETKTAKMMSIMRDSYVYIPGHGKSKINHAYAWGGESLLKETIQENFNIEADHVIKMNFQGFVSFFDNVMPQGLEVDVPSAMINHWKWDMEPGKQVLNGQQLLNYVRFRKDDEGDFGRVKRQQEVIGKVQKAIMEKLTNGEGIKTVSSLMREGKKAVETDLELGDLLKFGMTTMMNPVESFDSLRIPVEDSYRNVMTKDDGLVLELDAEANAEAVANFLNIRE